MVDRSPYAVPLEELERGVHVPAERLIESHLEPTVPHDLAFEDMALGRRLPPRA